MGRGVAQLVKKAAKKKAMKRGVKEVVKAVRKGNKGVCILAGNISPIDVITHLPLLCEDNDVPYCYVPSKEDLGAAAQTKRPTSCMLVSSQCRRGNARRGTDARKRSSRRPSRGTRGRTRSTATRTRRSSRR